jgi:glycosyltransferase involved in cell wall biosynthesis
VSQSVANRMFRDQGYDGDKLLTIYEAEDIGRFVPELSGQSVRDELGIRANIPVVGMVSKLQRPKGHEWFLRAAAKLRSKFPQAHFLIVGGPVDGHEQDAEFLHKLANDLGLSGNVKFMGQRNDVPQIMAACDVLVHCPTYHDPLPGVVTQAMAMQKPVVASRMGGIVEAIQHGVSGLLVPPANAEAIADAVTLLLENPQLRESMGRSGRNWVLENMHPDLYKEKLLAIYGELSGTS